MRILSGTVLFLSLLLPAGCGIMPYRAEEMSEHAVVLETPLTEQDDMYDCGLAAISALCGYYRVDIPTQQRAELAQLASSEKGLSGSELRTALERNGMEVYLFEGRLREGPTSLQDNIFARRPLLVMTELAGSHHYCLVVGVDPDNDTLVLLDPTLGRVVMQAADFERQWDLTQRFTMLAVPK